MNKQKLIFILVVAYVTIFGFLFFTEEFKEISPANFNKELAKRKDILTPEQLIKLYYNYATQANPNINISSEIIGKEIYLISLIRENVDDDSLWGEKIIMKAALNNNKWVVLEIKENWKCQSGRNFGWPMWGIESCN